MSYILRAIPLNLCQFISVNPVSPFISESYRVLYDYIMCGVLSILSITPSLGYHILGVSLRIHGMSHVCIASIACIYIFSYLDQKLSLIALGEATFPAEE